MSGVSRKLLGTTPAAGGQIDISDYFSTYLYVGNSSTQTITNGIDLAGEGGLVWEKQRTAAGDHFLWDSERGTKHLNTNNADAEADNGAFAPTFNSDGYDSNYGWSAAQSLASWTFRKAPRFFDVVTWTGDGVAGREIAHNLGTTVGTIIVKKTNDVGDWAVFHRSITGTGAVYINKTSSTITSDAFWNNTNPTDTVFTVGSSAVVNASGATYVAYLFAHDPLGPSGDGSDGLIACGSFLADNYSNGPEINLGWEPQWLLVKNATNGAVGWAMFDNMRGWTVDGVVQELRPNTSAAEASQTGYYKILPTGFVGGNAGSGGSTNTFIYIAIRRGPMRAPTSGTEVFDAIARTGTGSAVTVSNSLFSTDSVLTLKRAGGSYTPFVNRLTGSGRYLTPVDSVAEITQSETVQFDVNDGVKWPSSSTFGGSGNFSSVDYINYMFRRAPGFFDAVAYSGNSVAGRTVPHNLGVAPELMIVKSRSNLSYWQIYHSALGATKYIEFGTNGASTNSARWNDTTPTASDFILGNDDSVNISGRTYIAYLFATLPGVSKVGSYTGNGTSQTIDCGFTTGARFILIKRTDTNGFNWYVFDTARGIVSGLDPALTINTTDAEVTIWDMVDPDSSGFSVTSDGKVNASGGTFIYLAIA